MAYLDEDILYNNFEEKYKSAKGKAREAYSDVLDTICEMPRADVVPKSEYDAVVSAVDNSTKEFLKLHDAYQSAKAEVAREIFEEIESISSDFPIYGNVNTVILSERDLAFIKKKYTGEET